MNDNDEHMFAVICCEIQISCCCPCVTAAIVLSPVVACIAEICCCAREVAEKAVDKAVEVSHGTSQAPQPRPSEAAAQTAQPRGTTIPNL